MAEDMEIEDHLFTEKRKKRKERSDEEEMTDNKKRTIKICPQAPVSIKDNLQREVRAYKIFESKVQLIEMEDIEFRDLQEIKTKVSGMMKLIVQLCERKQENKINEEPTALENRLQKFEEAIKMATESIKELKNQSGKTTKNCQQRDPCGNKDKRRPGKSSKVRKTASCWAQKGSSFKKKAASDGLWSPKRNFR
ncbi:hypothetical protein M0802_014840 [Mischocyttarus mexicanus]|nr:hypothetical protein M0802_014840 [Mischocyttarus mexicanus]